ncbi:sulfatase-like hydrolase/transferase [Echinimonas agarilytica]|uniref:Sulfatase-like hydrolase/transferase n=1 Tax=Echinimonas agarilytica TaxID=1215918 RepID=A0AA42B6T6_9GAMM|nr:sulfatase-like hydrolase/transferase [Echinimonas agarilytica]MCM2678698.1 sulfatase-like hydrolase/transferase [Echinimonas agarilytica]
MKKIASLMLMACCCAGPALALQPNIVLITADDLGFDDLAIHGNPVTQTPHLDQLAQQSVQFSDFQVTPVCATSRASMLTGRHFYKTGVSGVHGGRDFMKLDELLISESLKDNGYATGTWGKWHVGKTAGYYPWDRGFDDAYYAELYVHENSYGLHNGQDVRHKAWASEVITDYAIDFIDRNKEQPFFAYLSFLAPHEPWLSPEQYVEPYREAGLREPIAQLYGMITEMDAQVGRLMAHLEKRGIADDTLVIFLSDNGPWWDSSNLGAMTQDEWAQRNPNQYSGNKGQSWQNGIKSPLFMRWQGTFKPGTVTHLTDISDLVPTLLALTNTARDAPNLPLDGVNFAASLRDVAHAKPLTRQHPVMIASHDVISNKPLFNQWTPIDVAAKAEMHPEQQWVAIRTEHYKLLQHASNDRAGYPQSIDNYLLVDMKGDPKEGSNIWNDSPETSAQMKSLLLKGYQAILDAPNSFKPPVYQIAMDGADVSVINAFGPSATWGNTQSKAHLLSEMKAAGDGAQYDIQVHDAGTYRLYLKQRSATSSAGMVVKLSTVGEQSQVITQQLSSAEMQSLGRLHLAPGMQQIKLEVVQNNSFKPWAQLNALRRIYLVKEHSKRGPTDLPLPN